jgi:hypothetical protein
MTPVGAEATDPPITLWVGGLGPDVLMHPDLP